MAILLVGINQEPLAVTKLNYPCFARHRPTGAIWLLVAPGQGLYVKPGNTRAAHVGEFSTDLTDGNLPDYWVLEPGQFTLSNG